MRNEKGEQVLNESRINRRERQEMWKIYRKNSTTRRKIGKLKEKEAFMNIHDVKIVKKRRKEDGKRREECKENIRIVIRKMKKSNFLMT